MTDHDKRRVARVETTHTDEATARRLARAVRPDNTAEMETAANGCRVVTTIGREDTGGLHATVDDYVVNLTAGARVLSRERSPSNTETTDETTTAECANKETADTHGHDTAEYNNE